MTGQVGTAGMAGRAVEDARQAIGWREGFHVMSCRVFLVDARKRRGRIARAGGFTGHAFMLGTKPGRVSSASKRVCLSRRPIVDSVGSIAYAFAGWADGVDQASGKRAGRVPYLPFGDSSRSFFAIQLRPARYRFSQQTIYAGASSGGCFEFDRAAGYRCPARVNGKPTIGSNDAVMGSDN